MEEIVLDVWLYGNLAQYGGQDKSGSFANPKVCLPEGSTISDLLEYLKMPTEERGITFINGDLRSPFFTCKVCGLSNTGMGLQWQKKWAKPCKRAKTRECTIRTRRNKSLF